MGENPFWCNLKQGMRWRHCQSGQEVEIQALQGIAITYTSLADQNWKQNIPYRRRLSQFISDYEPIPEIANQEIPLKKSA